MEITLVSKNQVNQIVLTPESEYEKNILKLIDNSNIQTTLRTGNFSQCQGGWIREYPHSDHEYSLMIVLKPKTE